MKESLSNLVLEIPPAIGVYLGWCSPLNTRTDDGRWLSVGDWIECGEDLCDFDVEGKRWWSSHIKLSIKSPVNGRIIDQATGDPFIDFRPFAKIQLSKGQEVPATAESVFSEFTEKLIRQTKFAKDRPVETVDKITRELLGAELTAREANDEEKKIIEKLDRKIS